jgi:predicted transcriptional regulator of viral defense system
MEDDEEFAEQCKKAEEYLRKKREPKVAKKGGIIFDSANYELEKKKKHQEFEGSDKEKEEEKK